MWDKMTYQRVSRISSTKVARGWHDFLLKELGEDSMTRPVKSSNKSMKMSILTPILFFVISVFFPHHIVEIITFEDVSCFFVCVL